MFMSDQTTIKKQCPICYSQNVKLVCSEGSISKYAGDGGSLSETEIHIFRCIECGIKFKYHGSLPR